MTGANRQAVVLLRVESELCGPISIGTAGLVKLLQQHLALPVDAAVALVDRCVFGAELVKIPLASRAVADALLLALRDYPPPARVIASLWSGET